MLKGLEILWQQYENNRRTESIHLVHYNWSTQTAVQITHSRILWAILILKAQTRRKLNYFLQEYAIKVCFYEIHCVLKIEIQMIFSWIFLCSFISRTDDNLPYSISRIISITMKTNTVEKFSMFYPSLMIDFHFFRTKMLLKAFHERVNRNTKKLSSNLMLIVSLPLLSKNFCRRLAWTHL